MITNTLRFPFLSAETPIVKPILKVTKKVRSLLRLLWGDPNFLVMSWVARFIVVREWETRRGNYSPRDAIDSTVIHSVLGACPIESPAQIAAQILAHGYYIGFSLRDDILTQLLTFAEINPCYANRNPAQPFYIRDREIYEQNLDSPLLIAGYLDSHEACDAYQTIKADPYLLEVASRYLNHHAVYMRGEISWGFPVPNSQAEKVKTARVYHCDINDFKTIKFFFYLTDVGEGSGPHVYLKGTHQTRQFGHQWIGQGCAAVDDQTLVQTYGRDRIQVVTGPAGTGFAGDPYCLHKGTVPKDKSRLLLQLEFGIHPYRIWYF